MDDGLLSPRKSTVPPMCATPSWYGSMRSAGVPGMGASRDSVLRLERFWGVITPRKRCRNRAYGPIWLNSGTKGIAYEGARK